MPVRIFVSWIISSIQSESFFSIIETLSRTYNILAKLHFPESNFFASDECFSFNESFAILLRSQYGSACGRFEVRGKEKKESARERENGEKTRRHSRDFSGEELKFFCADEPGSG